MCRYEADDDTARATAATTINPVSDAAPPLGATDTTIDTGYDSRYDAAQLATDNLRIPLQTPEEQGRSPHPNVGPRDGGMDMLRTETEPQGTGIKEDG